MDDLECVTSKTENYHSEIQCSSNLTAQMNASLAQDN